MTARTKQTIGLTGRVMVVLMALLFLPAAFVSAEDLFADVTPDHPTYQALKSLHEKGILKGFPGNRFEGNRGTNRFEVAVALFRTIDELRKVPAPLTEVDMKTLAVLTLDYASEMAAMGVTLDWIDGELKSIRRTINEDLAITSSHAEAPAERRFGSVTVTGDTWVHIDKVEHKIDTVDDNTNTFYQVALNLAATVNESVRIFVRLVNDDVAGAVMEDLEDDTVGVDVAFIEVDDVYDQVDVRAGRQFVSVGQGVVLDDKLDAVVFSRPIDRVDVSLVLADRDEGGESENGYSLKGIHARYDIGDNHCQLYFFQSTQLQGIEPHWYGLSLEGPVMDRAGPFKNVKYKAEYSRYDGDTPLNPVGSAWRGAVSWDMAHRLRATFTFGKGDEEFRPIGIHYWRRPLDLFGSMRHGALPAGSTLATGSLAGIEDTAFILKHSITDRLNASLIHERVAVNDNNLSINETVDYTRDTLGLDYRYKPNTLLELRWDMVHYDRTILNLLPNSGGWERYRLGMKVKF